MRLPVPSKRAVEEFKRLCKEAHSVTLTDEEAKDAATRLAQLAYLLSNEIYPICQEEQRRR